MKNVNKEILKTLTKVAAANPNPTEKFAAAIVFRNRIVSVGLNSMKSHPLAAKYGKNEYAIFLHSEVAAIKNALREVEVDHLTKCDLYIVRVKKEQPFARNVIWGLAKPCIGCQRAIAEFGLKRVIYTCDGGDYEVME